MELVKGNCFDNKFVRWYLRNFLNYLVHKDRKRALEIFSIIIEKYGKKNLIGQGEDVLLRYAVGIVTQISLSIEESEYLKLFEDLIMIEDYNMHVKKEIVVSIREDRFITDQSLTGKIIHHLHKLYIGNTLEVKGHVEFFFLYQLIQKNISLLPKIHQLLDEISKTKYPTPILNYDHTFHFTILEYIHKFFESFPEAAARYFLKVVELNEFLINSWETHMLVEILVKIFNSNLELITKRQAKAVLKKIDSDTYWTVRDLIGKTLDL